MFKEKIEQYLKAHELAWSSNTLRSERARLLTRAEDLERLTPQALYGLLAKEGLSSYSIKTTFIRIKDFYRWASLGDTYEKFMEEHARLFKNAYKRERIEVTYQEAKERINSLPDQEIRTLALDILRSGMRAQEAITRSGSEVVGKGGKRRHVFVCSSTKAPENVKYHALYRALKSVGLKPHTLRKLAATELARKGLQAHDLCEVFGWSNINTAQNYLQPLTQEKIGKIVSEVFE